MIPEQAKIADRLAVLRTVSHRSGDHTKGNHWMLTGFEGPDFNKPLSQRAIRYQSRLCRHLAARFRRDCGIAKKQDAALNAVWP